MSGNENNIVIQASNVVKLRAEEEIYIPRAERERKVHGRWIKEQTVLFPGYVFIDTDDIETITAQLNNIIGLTKVLKTGESFTAVTEEECALIRHLTGKDHIAEPSVAIKEGDSIVVISGPMKNLPGRVIYLNRHKRCAVVEMDIFSRKIEVTLGLEVVDIK